MVDNPGTVLHLHFKKIMINESNKREIVKRMVDNNLLKSARNDFLKRKHVMGIKTNGTIFFSCNRKDTEYKPRSLAVGTNFHGAWKPI